MQPWQQWTTFLSSMKLRDCKSRMSMIQQIMLGHVMTYVDERAHLVRDELRYSIQVPVRESIPTNAQRKTRLKWVRRVLRNSDMKRIFEELYP
jgi:hypothetical protein